MSNTPSTDQTGAISLRTGAKLGGSAPARLPLLARLRIAVDKWRIAGEMKCHQAARGRFFVLYNDGEKSMPMDHSTARDYAEIFGGKVIHKEFNCEC